jgi:hypothetical protein
LFSGVQFCVFCCNFMCEFLFFPTIQSSKCHVFATVMYCFFADSLKIFKKKNLVVFW